MPLNNDWIERTKLSHCNKIQIDIEKALNYLKGYQPLTRLESNANKVQLRLVKGSLYNAIVDLDQVLAQY